MSGEFNDIAVNIIPGTIDDVAALSMLEQVSSPYPWRQNQLMQSVKADHQLWLYRLVDAVAGYALLMPVLEEVELLNFVIFKDWQRQGHGRIFMQQLQAKLMQADYQRIHLEVRSSNTTAIRLYQDCGFIQSAIRRDYYSCANGAEDAIIMYRSLA